jgi:hypothetical protein
LLLFVGVYIGISMENSSRTVETREEVRVRDRKPKEARDYKTKKGLYRVYQVLWFILGFIEVMLALRFLFRMTAASQVSPIVNAVYNISAVFVAPFRAIFPTTPVTEAAAIEWTTLIAMLMWALIIWGIVNLLQLVKPVDRYEVEEGVDS